MNTASVQGQQNPPTHVGGSPKNTRRTKQPPNKPANLRLNRKFINVSHFGILLGSPYQVKLFFKKIKKLLLTNLSDL
ncbi:MAG: hypothetical protein ACRCUY_01900 [Thermoguttaceae bacterium]